MFKVNSTKNLLTPKTKICALAYSPPKFGKTAFAASLDEFTRKHRGKKTLIIACEAAEGGGTMTLSDKDIDYYIPTDYSDMSSLLSQLATDETYGGVVLDNATDYVVRLVKPHALKYPPKESALGARQEGVPVRSDYQVMSECARKHINQLVNLTNEKVTPERFRKDLIVTALEKEKEEDGISTVRPDMPGQLSSIISAAFQSVLCIGVKPRVVPDPKDPKKTIRLSTRYLHVNADGRRITDDRTKMFPHEFSLTRDDGSIVGITEIYENWLKGRGSAE